MESLDRHPADPLEQRAEAACESRLPGRWAEVLSDELDKPYFRQLMQFVGEERQRAEVYPPAAEVFAAFEKTSYEDVKVVILGQDPYHQPAQAHGLCFSVPRTTTKLPPSLRNIHVAMARDGFAAPLHGDLTGWTRQGVMLLNTALSVRDSSPNSHATQWREFTDAVIVALSDRHRPLVFVLWGRAAQRKRGLIDEDRHGVVSAPHPAARGRHQREFRETGTFVEVNRCLERRDLPPISWDRLE